MADTPLTLTAYDEVLKDVYEVGIAEVLNHSTVLMDHIKRNTKSIDFVGRQAIIPVELQDNEGFAFKSIATEPALPDAGVPVWDQSKTPIRGCFGTLRIDDPTMSASKNDKGAFAPALDRMVKNLKTAMLADMNRVMHGNGSGVLTVCGTTSAATKVVTAAYPGVKWIRNGMKVDIRTISSGTIVTDGSNILVSGRDPTVGDVHFDVPDVVTTASTEAVYRAGARRVEMMGIRGAIDRADPPTGDFQGIDRATYAQWQATVLDNPQGTGGTVRTLTLDLMQQAMDESEITNTGKVSLIMTTAPIRRKYLDLLVSDKRFVGGYMTLDGGFKALDYDGIGMVADKDCYQGYMYFIDESTFGRYIMEDWGWLQKDGTILKWNTGYASYTAAYRSYMELGCKNPSANTVIRDIDET